MARLARAIPQRHILTKLAVLPYAVLTGTALDSIDEDDITTGGKTIIITLHGDTWKAAGTGPIGSTADSDALLAGISGSSTWNTQVRDNFVAATDLAAADDAAAADAASAQTDANALAVISDGSADVAATDCDSDSRGTWNLCRGQSRDADRGLHEIYRPRRKSHADWI